MGQFEAVCLNHARDILVQVKEVVDPPPPEAAAAEAGEVPALPPRTLTAGDVTLLVHAHLLLGRVEQLAYQVRGGPLEHPAEVTPYFSVPWDVGASRAGQLRRCGGRLMLL